MTTEESVLGIMIDHELGVTYQVPDGYDLNQEENKLTGMLSQNRYDNHQCDTKIESVPSYSTENVGELSVGSEKRSISVQNFGNFKGDTSFVPIYINNQQPTASHRPASPPSFVDGIKKSSLPLMVYNDENEETRKFVTTNMKDIDYVYLQSTFRSFVGAIQRDVWLNNFSNGNVQYSLWRLFVTKSMMNHNRVLSDQNIHMLTDGCLMKYVWNSDPTRLAKIFIKIFAIFNIMVQNYPQKLGSLLAPFKNALFPNKTGDSQSCGQSNIQESILVDSVLLSFSKLAVLIDGEKEAEILKHSVTDKITKLFLYQFLRESEYLSNSISNSIRNPSRKIHLSESSLSFSQSWNEIFKLEPDPKCNSMYKTGLTTSKLPDEKIVAEYVKNPIVPCHISCSREGQSLIYSNGIDFFSERENGFSPLRIMTKGMIQNIDNFIKSNINQNYVPPPTSNTRKEDVSNMWISTIFGQISAIDDNLVDDIFTVLITDFITENVLSNQQSVNQFRTCSEQLFQKIGQKILLISEQNDPSSDPLSRLCDEKTSTIERKDYWIQLTDQLFSDVDILTPASQISSSVSWVLANCSPQTQLITQLNQVVETKSMALLQMEHNLKTVESNNKLLLSENTSLKTVISQLNQTVVNLQAQIAQQDQKLQQGYTFTSDNSDTNNINLSDNQLNSVLVQTRSLMGLHNMAAESKEGMKRSILQNLEEKCRNQELFVDQKETTKSKETITNTLITKFVHLIQDISSVIHVPFFFRVLSMNWTKKMECEMYSPCPICKILGHNRNNCVFIHAHYVGSAHSEYRDLDEMLKKSEILIKESLISVFKETLGTMMDFTFTNINEVYKPKIVNDGKDNSMYNSHSEATTEIPNTAMTLYYNALYNIFDFSTIFNLKDISRAQMSTSTGEPKKAARLGTTLFLSPLWPTAAISMFMINREAQFYAKSGTQEGSRICMEFSTKNKKSGSLLRLKNTILSQAEIFNNQNSTSTTHSTHSSSVGQKQGGQPNFQSPSFTQILETLMSLRLKTMINFNYIFSNNPDFYEGIVSGDVSISDVILTDDNNDMIMKEQLSMESITKTMPFCKRKSDVDKIDNQLFVYDTLGGYFNPENNTTNPNQPTQQYSEHQQLSSSQHSGVKEPQKKRREYAIHYDYRLPMAYIADIAQTVMIMNAIEPEEIKENSYIEEAIRFLSDQQGVQAVKLRERITVYPPIYKEDENKRKTDTNIEQIAGMLDFQEIPTQTFNADEIRRPLEVLTGYLSDYDIIPQKKGDYFCLPTKQDMEMRGSIIGGQKSTENSQYHPSVQISRNIQKMKSKGYTGGATNLGYLRQRLEVVSPASSSAIFGATNSRDTGQGCGWLLGDMNSIVDCSTKAIFSRYVEITPSVNMPVQFRQSLPTYPVVMSCLFSTLVKAFFILARVKNSDEFMRTFGVQTLPEQIPRCDTGIMQSKEGIVHQKSPDVFSKVSKYFSMYAHIYGCVDPALYNIMMTLKRKTDIKRISSNYALWDDARVGYHEMYLEVMKKGGQGKKTGSVHKNSGKKRNRSEDEEDEPSSELPDDKEEPKQKKKRTSQKQVSKKAASKEQSSKNANNGPTRPRKKRIVDQDTRGIEPNDEYEPPQHGQN